MFETGFSLTLTELVHCWLLTFGLWDQSLFSIYKRAFKYHSYDNSYCMLHIQPTEGETIKRIIVIEFLFWGVGVGFHTIVKEISISFTAELPLTHSSF